MPSPVQSNCDAHDTIANGQYGAVWSMGHTQQVCVRIVLLPSNVWQQFFVRSAFLRQKETDLPPAELWSYPMFMSRHQPFDCRFLEFVRGHCPHIGLLEKSLFYFRIIRLEITFRKTSSKQICTQHTYQISSL
ncbi:hypothetical protein TNCV_3061001 [Trichonephila clavipes]|nr:hypothetical protein TNCV_3061001 [Trichonephila clavipes]